MASTAFRNDNPGNAAKQNQRASQQALTRNVNLTPAQLARIKNPYPDASMPKDAQGNATFVLPYPNAPHDGGPQDLANTKAISQQGGAASAAQSMHDNAPGFMDKLIPMIAIGMATGGVGAGVGGAVGDAAAAAGYGTTAASVAGGVAGGATAGGLSSAVQGQSLGNIGKGALIGGIGGGIGAGAKPLASSLASSGMNPALASGLVRGGIGAGTGALGAELSGGNAGNAAFLGGIGGFTSGATGSNILGKVATGFGGMALGGGNNGSGSSGGSGVSGGTNYLGAGAGGQGNNGNMASTDSTLAGTITGALPGLLQGAAGVYGSQNAAEKMTQADQNAIGTQTSTLGNINSIWSTQQGLGQGADKALGSALGTNGQPADYSGFENMPGYKFAVGQGTQAIQRQAASMGNAYTPNTAEAVGQYVTGTAAQDYNTYISQLMGAAGLGTSANQGIANPTYQTGANISQLQQNQGYAQASGVSGAANAVGGMFGSNGVGTSLIGAAGRYLGGGSSGGGGGGSAGGGGGGGGGSGGSLFQGPMSNWNNTGAGNGTWNSGYDPNTGGSWVSPGSTDMSSSFDSGSWNNTPSMPDIEGGSTDFGGGLDFGSDASGGMDFLGGWG